MKMRNIAALAAALVVSAASTAALPAFAATKDISFTQVANACKDGDDGHSVRLNILNVWGGNNYSCISKETTVSNNITVTIHVSGLSADHPSNNVNDDGSTGDQYYAWMNGSAGTNSLWYNSADYKSSPTAVAINGDGDYTFTWNLAEDSGTIDALIIDSNINFYQLKEDVKSFADSGVSFSIVSITTEDPDAGETEGGDNTTEGDGESTEANNNNETPGNGDNNENGGDNTNGGDTAETSTTAEGAAGAATTTTTTAASGGSSSTRSSSSGSSSSSSSGGSSSGSSSSAADTSTNAATSDNGIAIVLGALTAAGAVAYVTKKRIK